MKTMAMVSLVLIAACGGGGGSSSGGDTTPDDNGDEEVVDDEGGDDEMIPPERMDEITRQLDRKRDTSGKRCLERAIDNQELKKNARGSIQFNFVISSGGTAKDLEIVKNSFEESPLFTECMTELLTGIEFGSLPRDLPWSYKFKYEAF